MMSSDSITSHCDGSKDIHPIKLRTYQVVVAVSKNLGLGKDGKMAWDLPLEYKFFLTVTRVTDDRTKRNAVIMGRKTWEATPSEHRPLVGVLNVVLTRSLTFNVSDEEENVVICRSLVSALELLATSIYCQSIERVFLIGGGDVLKDSLNAPQCDAIHLTEIDANIECDTFIPAVDSSIFQPWYSSFPTVENKLRYSFTSYVCVKKSVTSSLEHNNDLILDGGSNTADINVDNFSFLPTMILQRHEEYMYLRHLQDIISNGTLKDDKTKTSTLSKFGCQMRFNLRKSFPLMTTKKIFWQEVVEELLGYLHPDYNNGQGFDQLSEVISQIKNNSDERPIILSAWDLMGLPHCHMFGQFYIGDGELSCQMYQHSVDMCLEVPFSIASYALLTCMIAHVCELVPGDFVHVIGDAHVYTTHVRYLEDQIQKQPVPFPILKINPLKKDIVSFLAADFDIIGGKGGVTIQSGKKMVDKDDTTEMVFRRKK